MKAIFFLILIINSLFFAWQYFLVDETSAPTVVPINKEIEAPQELLLLSERADVSAEKKLRKERAIAPSFAEQTATEKESPPLCTLLGPYEQLLQAEYAVERLAALGADVHIVPLEIKQGDSFWVYLNPEVSEREALNRLYELQKKNIESHIISKGELTNGISFGRFSVYDEAEMLAAEIRKHGYDAQIKIMPKTILETWVVVNSQFGEKIDDMIWKELIAKQKGLEKRQNYCLGVASP